MILCPWCGGRAVDKETRALAWYECESCGGRGPRVKRDPDNYWQSDAFQAWCIRDRRNEVSLLSGDYFRVSGEPNNASFNCAAGPSLDMDSFENSYRIEFTENTEPSNIWQRWFKGIDTVYGERDG